MKPLRFRAAFLLLLSLTMWLVPAMSEARLVFYRPAATARPKVNEPIAAMAVLSEVNRYRAQHRLSPLTLNARLNQAAQAHAEYMARTRNLSHTGSQGSDPGDRVQAAGYSWRQIAENVAEGQQSAREVVGDWIQSPGHRRNLLHADVTEAGVGYRGDYWALTLAHP